jgi:hypothetical protein
VNGPGRRYRDREGTFLSRRYCTDFDPGTMSERGPRVVLRSTHFLPPVQTMGGVAFPAVRDRGILATVVRALETELEEVRRYLSRERSGYLLQLAQEDSEDLQKALGWARAELERWNALQERAA